MLQRDKLGRFINGNQVAKGNKGNTNPKWGNKNALKHGLYSTFNMAKVHSDGHLYIYLSWTNIVKVAPKHFFKDKQGRIRIHEEVATELERMGVELEEI